MSEKTLQILPHRIAIFIQAFFLFLLIGILDLYRSELSLSETQILLLKLIKPMIFVFVQFFLQSWIPKNLPLAFIAAPVVSLMSSLWFFINSLGWIPISVTFSQLMVMFFLEGFGEALLLSALMVHARQLMSDDFNYIKNTFTLRATQNTGFLTSALLGCFFSTWISEHTFISSMILLILRIVVLIVSLQLFQMKMQKPEFSPKNLKAKFLWNEGLLGMFNYGLFYIVVFFPFHMFVLSKDSLPPQAALTGNIFFSVLGLFLMQWYTNQSHEFSKNHLEKVQAISIVGIAFCILIWIVSVYRDDLLSIVLTASFLGFFGSSNYTLSEVLQGINRKGESGISNGENLLSYYAFSRFGGILAILLPFLFSSREEKKYAGIAFASLGVLSVILVFLKKCSTSLEEKV